MVANCCTEQQALLNASTLTWTPTGSGKFNENDDGRMEFTPRGQGTDVGDAYTNIGDPNGKNSKSTIPRLARGPARAAQSCNSGIPTAPMKLVLRCCGPTARSLPLERTAPAPVTPRFTTPATVAELPGPDFPGNLDVADGPAALLPDGNVLVSASPGIFLNGTVFFEWDGSNLNPVPATPNSPGNSSWYGRMLVLPTGQVLYTDGSSNVEIYTPAGTANPNWAPSALLSISSPIISRGSTIMLSGRKFNGFSQANAYGDDAQAASNYPIVRLTNVSTGHVFYCRTHDHSTMAVAYQGPAFTHVDIPANMETGQTHLEVIANGIASPKYNIGVR